MGNPKKQTAIYLYKTDENLKKEEIGNLKKSNRKSDKKIEKYIEVQYNKHYTKKWNIGKIYLFIK